MRQTAAEYVAGEVRAELGRQGRSAQWLAARLGRSEVWVSRRLRNVTSWTVDDLAAIAEALGVPAAQLLPIRERVS